MRVLLVVIAAILLLAMSPAHVEDAIVRPDSRLDLAARIEGWTADAVRKRRLPEPDPYVIFALIGAAVVVRAGLSARRSRDR